LPELAVQRRPIHPHINPTDEFRRHAADCERMAKFTRDPQSKETWNRMAQRWAECAERFQHDREAVHRPALRYRKSPRAWAEH
jgi:hypothetical protein